MRLPVTLAGALAGLLSAGAVAADPLPYDAKTMAAKTLATYQAWDFHKCPDEGTCGGYFSQAVGIETYVEPNTYQRYAFNPRAAMDNPDPEWLPGWAALPATADDPNASSTVSESLAVAAGRRAWRAGCEATYDTVAKAAATRDHDLDAAILAANAKTDPYARLAGLLALRAPLDQQFNPDDAGSYLGDRYQVELAIHDAFHALDLDDLYVLGGYAPPLERARLLRPLADDDSERLAFCVLAADGHERAFAKPPITILVNDAAVRPLFTDEEQARVDALAKLADAPTRLELDRKLDFWPDVDLREETRPEHPLPDHPELAVPVGNQLVVKSVAGNDVVLQEVDKSYETYGCRDTKHVSSISDDGTVNYHSVGCKTTDLVDTITVKVHFRALPADETLAPGDAVRAIGKLGKVTSKKGGNQKKRTLTVDATLDDAFLLAVGKAGATPRSVLGSPSTRTRAR